MATPTAASTAAPIADRISKIFFKIKVIHNIKSAMRDHMDTVNGAIRKVSGTAGKVVEKVSDTAGRVVETAGKVIETSTSLITGPVNWLKSIQKKLAYCLGPYCYHSGVRCNFVLFGLLLYQSIYNCVSR
jgi:phage-related protein